MANRKKSEEQKLSANIMIRVTPELKTQLDVWANATGVGLSERARTLLEADLRKWERTQKPKT